MREDDTAENKIAYKEIVEFLKERKVRGATVLKSIMGYGTTGEYHYKGIEVLSYRLPVVVEFVEEKSKAIEVLGAILSKVAVGLVILKEVELCCSS